MSAAKLRALLPVALFGLLAAGCAGGTGDAMLQTAQASTADAPIAMGSSFAGTPQAVRGYSAHVNVDLQSIVDRALADAERRTGREQSALQVISREAVTWPDGGLGCPQPGMNYTMALVPGYRIRIQAGADVLDYHVSRRGYLVLCPQGRSVEPVDDGKK